MKENKEKRFISILSDYGFKVTFANESDTTFLKRALRALIQKKEKIKSIQFLRNEFAALTKDSRGGLYDLICEDEKGNIFIVEMQLAPYKEYMQRAKFYAFQRMNTYVRKGKYNFGGLPQIYCIGFLAKNIYPSLKTYYHFGTLKNQFGENLDQQISHIIIEISKFDKDVGAVKSDLDKLIFTMKYLDTFDELKDLPPFLSEDWLSEITKRLDKSAMSPEQRMNFEMILAKNASIDEMLKEEKELERQKMKEEVKEEVREEVKEEVREKVKEEVREKVEEEVREKVEEEVREKVEEEVREKVEEKVREMNLSKALQLKELGTDYVVIAKVTGLSLEEIQDL